MNCHALQFIIDCNLAGKPAFFIDTIREIQNIGFEFFAVGATRSPVWCNVNVASRAGAQTTAVTFNTWDKIIDGTLH